MFRNVRAALLGMISGAGGVDLARHGIPATQGGGPAPDAALDITAETCPMTYVRTRLALDRLGPGQVLAVRLRGADPLANVPRSAAAQGHTVLSVQDDGDGVSLVLIRRRPAPAP